MDVLMTMPISDRRFYIMMHNKQDNSPTSVGEDIESNEETDKLNMLSGVKDWH